MSDLMDLCRKKGVIRIRHVVDPDGKTETELLFAPNTAPGVAKAGKKDADPLADKRDYYETLLSKPITDKELDLLP